MVVVDFSVGYDNVLSYSRVLSVETAICGRGIHLSCLPESRASCYLVHFTDGLRRRTLRVAYLCFLGYKQALRDFVHFACSLWSS